MLLLALLCAVSALLGSGAAASAAKPKAEAQLDALLAKGSKKTGQTVQMGEILGIGAPGSGETIRIHSAWNTARHVSVDAVTVLIGRLGNNLPSDQVVSTVDVTKGTRAWIKSTRAGAKWTYEKLPVVKKPSGSLLTALLKNASHTKVKRVSASHGLTRWSIAYTTTDLQSVNALKGQLGKVPALSKKDRSLLSGEELKVRELQITLDRFGRPTALSMGGVMTETRADASARHQPYPKGGVKGVLILRLAYTYGGTLAITPPPKKDVSNSRRPLS